MFTFTCARCENTFESPLTSACGGTTIGFQEFCADCTDANLADIYERNMEGLRRAGEAFRRLGKTGSA
jgi:hypothetical protein